jgi:AcrR family transcriptional regulator
MSSKPMRNGLKKKILQAAAAEFEEKGYTGSRVDAIARRAGVNKALLYYHLGDKETLYSEVILSNLRRAEAALSEALDDLTDPGEKFRAVIRTVARMVSEAPYLPRLILTEAAFGGEHLPEPVLKGIARVFSLIRSVLEEGQTSGNFRPTNPLLTHFTIAGSIMFLSASAPLRRRLARLADPELQAADSPAEIADHVTDLLLHGLVEDDHAERRPRGKGE